MFKYVNVPEYQELETKIIKGIRWYKTPSNEFYPSITSVLGSKQKPYLENWRQMLGPQKAKQETDRCAARGTTVHLLAEMFLKNQQIDQKQYPREQIVLFNQMKPILKKINNIRVLEAPLYSDEFLVAGRTDCVAEFNGVLSIIDYKTSTNNKNEKMIEDYFLQETFYALSYYELFGEKIEQIVTIMVVEKGAIPLVWKKSIYPYIVPLKKRIDQFYDNLN